MASEMTHLVEAKSPSCGFVLIEAAGLLGCSNGAARLGSADFQGARGTDHPKMTAKGA